MQTPRVVITLDGDRFTAVMADVTGARPRVEAWVEASAPAGVVSSDPNSVGAWIKSVLRERGVLKAARRPGVLFPVSRAEVVLKRLALPGTTRPAELPEIIRLQMLRQASVAGEELTIDFAPIESAAGRGAGAEVSHLAGAVASPRMEWRRAVCRAAGIRLLGAPLGPAGYAALFRPGALRLGGATIGVAVGGGATEFLVMEEGALAFARVVPGLGSAGEDADADRLAARIGVEAKRTWMAHRAGPQALPVETVSVLGDDDLARRAAAECGRALEVPAAALPLDLDLSGVAGGNKSLAARIAPLVGSLIEAGGDHAAIDFAHPRRSPDAAAGMRRRVLTAAFLALLVGGGLFTLGRLDLSRREGELAGLKARWSEQSREHAEFIRQRARVQHLERWRTDKVDWTTHIKDLTGRLPDPTLLRLDGLVMTTDSEVLYTKPKGDNGYSDRAWSSRTAGTLSLSGSMSSRAAADGLRAQLLAEKQYQLESVGPDVPNRFEFRLRLTPAATGTAAPAAKPKGAGA